MTGHGAESTRFRNSGEVSLGYREDRDCLLETRTIRQLKARTWTFLSNKVSQICSHYVRDTMFGTGAQTLLPSPPGLVPDSVTQCGHLFNLELGSQDGAATPSGPSGDRDPTDSPHREAAQRPGTSFYYKHNYY